MSNDFTLENILDADQALKMIRAMPPGEVPDKCELMELHYQQWRRVRRWYRRPLAWFARDPLRILRAEVAELAQFTTNLMIRQKAVAANQDFIDQYHRIIGEAAEFRKFLMSGFPQELEEAEAKHISLFDLAKGLLVKHKHQLGVQP